MEPQVVAEEPTTRGRWRAWLVAGLMALVGWTLSPADWPAEPARLTVSNETGILLDASVPVGEQAPLNIESGAVSIEFPDGIGTSGRVAGTVSGADPDAATVELILADGRVERFPVVSVDEAAATFEVSRRPPVSAGVVLALLGFVVVMWVTEAIPLFLTSLSIPVVLVVAGVAEPGEALAPFFHPIIALFFGGFLMAEAMKKVSLDRTAAVTLVAAAGRSPVSLLVGMMAVSAFLSMWMSNTAAAAVLVPIAIGVTAPIDHPGYRKVAVLGIAYAATLGGVGSAIGTPANPLAIEFLSSFAGREVSFVEWFGFGVPMVVIFLPVVAAYLWWRMGVKVDTATFDRVRAAARAEVHTAGRMDRGQWVVLGVFGSVMVAWLTQTFHGVDTGIIALAGAVALGVLRMVDTDDLARISWSALLTFGGGLALGVYLTRTGTSDWLATRLVGLESVPSGVGVAVIAIATLALTTVASNTATAAMMIPLAIPLAGVVGVDPSLLVVIVAIASSIDFALVIGTPPTMIAYSTKLFTTREIFRTGIVLDLLGIVLLVTVVSWIWQVLGVL
jgi:solute carrier family 13 (sodium-dependent dicarboxylate transporter), member 2/3/5